MKRSILIRFDDICPTMDWEQWKRAESMLEEYNIKPLLGIIPDSVDPELEIDKPKNNYWNYIHDLQERGYVFAMHGYQHNYDIKRRGMVNSGFNSEFAGHTYEVQFQKIAAGKKILKQHGIQTDIFFAPSHSYDANTLLALKECGFKYISDGKSRKKRIQNGIECIPCRSGGVPAMKDYGFYTAVFHAHEWARPEKKVGYDRLKKIITNNSDEIVDFYTFVDCYPTGNDFVQKIDERLYVFYERNVHPRLSKIKHVVKRG